MIETFLTAFTTFFAVIGPIDTAVLLASLTPNMTAAERRAISVKAVVIATIIILLFALVGQPVLTELGVSLAALQTAGGIILFMIALEMTLASGPVRPRHCPQERARKRKTRPSITPRLPSSLSPRRCSRAQAP